MRVGMIVWVVLGIGLVQFEPALGTVVFVDGRAVDCGDGQSWATAWKYLQDALAAARDSAGAITEIWVAAGTYQPDRDCAHPAGTGDRTVAFDLIDGVALHGGFAGNEDPATFNLSRRDLLANATVLSGDLAGDDGPDFANNGENSYHVVRADAVGATAVLDGFTVSHGNANEPSGNPDSLFNTGGGMYSTNGARPNVLRCFFTGNSCQYHGGAVASHYSSPTLIGCTWIGNSTPEGSGGGMFGYHSSPVLLNCLFYKNKASIGALFIWYGSPVLVNCTVAGNTCYAAIGTSGASTKVTNCILWDGMLELTGSVTVTYSCVRGGHVGEGNTDADPLFVDLAAGDLRLSAGSPCIDAGSNAALPGDVLTDLDGRPRFMDDPAAADCRWSPGTCGAGPILDMGAYEYIPVIPGDFNHDGHVNADELTIFLACVSGPSVAWSGDCGSADLDHDGDVDQSDFGVFQRCLSGNDQSADPRCGD